MVIETYTYLGKDGRISNRTTPFTDGEQVTSFDRICLPIHKSLAAATGERSAVTTRPIESADHFFAVCNTVMRTA